MDRKEFDALQVGSLVWADLGRVIFKVRIDKKDAYGFARVTIDVTQDQYPSPVMDYHLFATDSEALARIDTHLSYYKNLRAEIANKRNGQTLGK